MNILCFITNFGQLCLYFRQSIYQKKKKKQWNNTNIFLLKTSSDVQFLFEYYYSATIFLTI